MVDERIKQLAKYEYSDAQTDKSQIWWMYEAAMATFFVTDMNRKDEDSYGVRAKNKLVNRLISMLNPGDYNWGLFEPPRGVPATEPDKKLLQNNTEVIFNRLQEYSNFEIENFKFMANLTIGTAAMRRDIMGDLGSPVRYRNVPLKNLYISEGALSKVQHVFYENKGLSISKVRELWPDANLEGFEENQRELDIIEGTIYDSKTKKYHYLVSKGSTFEEIIYSEEMDETNWLVARWGSFENNSSWGVGPGIEVVLEALSLRKKKQNLRVAGDLNVRPPLKGYGDRALITRAKFGAGDTTYVGKSRGQADFEPLITTLGADLDIYNVENHQKLIDDAFYAQYLPDLSDVKNVTATAIQALRSEFRQIFEPVYTRVIKEYLKPILLDYFNIMDRAKIGGVDKSQLSWIEQNPNLGVRFKNMLTMTQDNEELERLNLFLGNVNESLGANYNAAFLKGEEAYQRYIDLYHTDRKLFYNVDEAKENMQKIIQQSQEAAQAMQGGGQ